ncbi:MAG: hypothetical protein PHF84_00710 [bacterium]|nr:hypothetical protein [bacterium]
MPDLIPLNSLLEYGLSALELKKLVRTGIIPVETRGVESMVPLDKLVSMAGKNIKNLPVSLVSRNLKMDRFFRNIYWTINLQVPDDLNELKGKLLDPNNVIPAMKRQLELVKNSPGQAEVWTDKDRELIDEQIEIWKRILGIDDQTANDVSEAPLLFWLKVNVEGMSYKEAATKLKKLQEELKRLVEHIESAPRPPEDFNSEENIKKWIEYKKFWGIYLNNAALMFKLLMDLIMADGELEKWKKKFIELTDPPPNPVPPGIEPVRSLKGGIKPGDLKATTYEKLKEFFDLAGIKVL